MNEETTSPRLLLVVAGVWIAAVTTPVFAENIDPANDDSQRAYAANVGWLNAEPSGDGGSGIHVGDSELSGWMWGENIGWASLSCKNTLTCDIDEYGVLNDGNGGLSGYAWAENVGWIDFAPSTSGVTIDPATGDFSGYAWGENIGWISFNCTNTASCGDVDYKVKTEWVCDPPPPAPSGSPSLRVDESGIDTELSWGTIIGETGYDIVHGDLACLRSSGSFAGCTLGCLDDNRTTTNMLHDGLLGVGNGHWYLVRGQNCGGNGTYGSIKRDSEITDCP
jgi:hypothetical protein